MAGTKEKLLAAAIASLRKDGIAGISARAIAGEAEVNQALIFYHFGSVNELIDAACRRAVEDSTAFYREQFAAVTSLTELLTLGRWLHEQERDKGNVAVMAQLMSGAQRDETLAATSRYAMGKWTAEIESVVTRVLKGSPLAEVADPGGMARAISAGFIGLELYDGVDPEGGTMALDALEKLGLLVDVIDDLGPVARRAVRAKVKSSARKSAR